MAIYLIDIRYIPAYRKSTGERSHDLPTSNGNLTEVLCCVPGKDKESKMLSVPKPCLLQHCCTSTDKEHWYLPCFWHQIHKWAKHDLIEAVSLPITTDGGSHLETWNIPDGRSSNISP